MKTKQQILNEQFKNWYSRNASAKVESAKDDSMIVSGVLATEQPVIVFDWYRWEAVREILIMKGATVPENGQVPLLDSHSRFSTSQIKGSTRNIQSDKSESGDPILTADYYFEREAKREYNLVKDKHLTDTSIGYRTYDEFTIVLAPHQTTNIDGKEYRNEYGDDLSLLIRTKWDLKENSLVAIGADDRAKFRSQFISEQDLNVNEPSIDPKEIEGIKESIKELNNHIKIISIKGEFKMNEEEKKLEQERRDQIRAFDKLYDYKGKGEVVNSAIDNNWSVEKFKAYVIDNMKGSGPVNQQPSANTGLSEKEIQRYSLVNMIRAEITKDYSKVGMEREQSAEVSRILGKTSRGFFVPGEILTRTLSVGTNAQGGYLVGTKLVPESFIDMLYNKLILPELGVDVWDNLTENIAVPGQSASATGYWLSEGGDITASDQTFKQVPLSPKTAGALTVIRRKLLIQSTPKADQIVLKDLVRVIAQTLQTAFFNGTGANNQPTGLSLTSNIGGVVAAGLTWEAALEFLSDVETANADVPTMSYVMKPSHKTTLMTRLKSAGVSGYICENNQIGGYPVKCTNSVTSGQIFFGDWSQAIMALWNDLDILVNPYQNDNGDVRISVFQSADFGFKVPGAFSYASDFS